MSFQGPVYFVFLLLIWLVAGLTRRATLRQLILLAASYLFYSTWSPTFLVLLVGVSLFDYFWGRLLRRRPSARVLWAGVAVNVGVLLVSKYVRTLLIHWVIESPGPTFEWLIPVGVSFYAFQGISYLVDVYRGYDQQPAWPEFFLYMSFWPVVLSGPICRLPEMLPQFRAAEGFSGEDLRVGVRRIIVGLFLKTVLADTLAGGFLDSPGVDSGFDELTAWGSTDVLFLALGYGFQIFFDFAGYTHIAIGSARLLGIRVPENFDAPYWSVSPSEFWTRWHMSLSFWIRDYLFFPLAMLNRGRGWRQLALLVSMTVFGAWHGIGFTFVLWGLYQGLVLMGHRRLQQWTLSGTFFRLPVAVGTSLAWLATFSLITAGWILFRAATLGQASAMYTSLFLAGEGMLPGRFYRMVLAIGGGYFLITALHGYFRMRPLLERWLGYATPAGLTAMLILVIIWSDQASPFVYVNF